MKWTADKDELDTQERNELIAWHKERIRELEESPFALEPRFNRTESPLSNQRSNYDVLSNTDVDEIDNKRGDGRFINRWTVWGDACFRRQARGDRLCGK